jgi:LemA protein
MRLWAIVCAVLAPLAFYAAFAMLRRRQLLAQTPTSRCAAVFMGWNEVRGSAYTPTPSTSHFSQLACVYWQYSVEEEIRTTRTITSTDAQGHTSTRTQTDYSWNTIDAGGDRKPLFVVDPTGSVAVSFEGASVRPTSAVDRILGHRPFFGGDGPTGRIREREQVIAVGEAVFVCGDAVLDDQTHAPVIRGNEGGPFVIATGEQAESRVRSRFEAGGFFLAFLAVGLCATASVLAFLREGDSVSVEWIPGLVIGLAVLAGCALTLAYNGLVRVRNRADRAFSLVDVMLQRRHDLIGNLVEVVRGYAQHEQQLQAQLAALRSAARTDVATADTDASEQTVLAREVFARAEAYPAVKADDAFTRFQRALSDAEDRIGAAREFYNESVTALRDRTHTFPGSLLARFGDFHDRPLFAPDAFERSTEHVSFGVDA